MKRRYLLRLLGFSAIVPACSSPAPAPAAVVASQGERPEPDVDLTLTASADEVSVLPGQPSSVWRFAATLARGPASTLQPIPRSYLGPILRFRRGQRIRIRFRNRLSEPSIVHWHGLDVPESADGHPRFAVEGGQDYVSEFEVTNRAGTYWYHPHPHMRTAPQVYQGLAGLLLISDPEEEALGLPSGRGELVCVLQDRRFDRQNQFVYASAQSAGQRRGMGRGMGPRGMMGMAGMMETVNGWLGDRVLVNGLPASAIDVDRRTYRIRFLNGSNARIYKLAWNDGTPFTVIGGDGGLLERARTMNALTLAPAQRADVLLELSDRSPGTTIQLRSLSFPSDAVGNVGMAGMMPDTSPAPQGTPFNLMTLRIATATGPRVRLPERLCAPPASWQVKSGSPVRSVPLTFMRMEWLLGGRTFEMEDVSGDETARAGSTHVWEFRNEPNPMGMAMAHPIHLHGPQFRVLSRSGTAENPLMGGIFDDAATDTVLVLPGQTVRTQITFSNHRGLYLYHCHILEHEDMGMMRNFRITG